MLYRQCQGGPLKEQKLLQNKSIDKESTCEAPYKVHSFHSDTEDNSAWKNGPTISENLISLNTGECIDEGFLYSTVESISNCCARDSSTVGSIYKHIQDGNISEKVDNEESAHGSSRTEVLYWEILDVSCRNQVVKGSKSQEHQ